jgi:hypothetical protein
MRRKQKFYVVWRGREVGILTSWPETEAQVKGFSGARYKSYTSFSETTAALAAGPPDAVLYTYHAGLLPAARGREQPLQSNAGPANPSGVLF